MVSALISQASRYILNPAHFPTVACGAAVASIYISTLRHSKWETKKTTYKKEFISSYLPIHLVDSLSKATTTIALMALSQAKPIQAFLPKSHFWRFLILSSPLMLKSVDIIANTLNLYIHGNSDDTIAFFRHKIHQLSSIISIVSSLALMYVAATHSESVKRGLGAFVLGAAVVVLNVCLADHFLFDNDQDKTILYTLYTSNFAILGTAAIVSRCFQLPWLFKNEVVMTSIFYSIFNISFTTAHYNSLKP